MPLMNGRIMQVDTNEISIKNMQTKKLLTISWDQLKFAQFSEFTDYYASSISDEFYISADNKEVFSAVAEEYKKLAVFLSWYGQKEQAGTIKIKAARFNVEVSQELEQLLN